jgi:hypothetical protein
MKIVSTIKSLYEEFKRRVVHEGKLTDSFEVPDKVVYYPLLLV